MGLLLVLVSQKPELERTVHERDDLRRKLASVTRGVGRETSNTLNDLKKLQELLPLKREYPSILEDIIDTASMISVTLGAVTYKPIIIKEQELLAYEATIQASGSYVGIKRFLFNLQIIEELIVVESVRFSNEDPYAEKVTMETKLMVYLRDQK